MDSDDIIAFCFVIIAITLLLILIEIYFFPGYIQMENTIYFDNITNESIIKVSDFDDIGRMLNTTSMLPTLPPGSKLLITYEYSVNLGDIILVYPEDIIYEEYAEYRAAHRVVEISSKEGQECYITKGDNSLFRDSGCFLKEETYGKVVGVLY